jgi:hypothetical protein
MKGAEIAETVTPPPMPWTMRGRMYMGLFRFAETGPASSLPGGLQPVLSGHRVLVLVRYLEGTLRYDELVIARLARLGMTTSMFVDHIWVDSEESVSGGRRFWGLPKELAQFDWDGDRVHVHDVDGDIATLTVDQRPARLPKIPLVAAGFGVREDGRLLLAKSKLSVSVRRSSLRVESLDRRFGTLTSGVRMGFDAAPFEMTIGAPRVLD